ncbi:MAG: winged helix DNA-binding domain-containing protein [Rikenellaceae bacterium]|nr:winged helix DNA-binding domain-containing protein [Rikenellaceae bacterium]
MNSKEVLFFRLRNHCLAGLNSPKIDSVEKVVAHLGAVQAQEYKLSKWGIGSRADSSGISVVDKAINSGKIIRTHILRPTWHFVSAEDLRWMSDLCRRSLDRIYKTYCRKSPIQEEFIRQNYPVVVRALRDNNHLTNTEITETLSEKIPDADNSLSRRILFRMEIEGIICGGRVKSGHHTYALLDEWVPVRRDITRDEALSRLALKYFKSHGPAEIMDFVWWSGLTVTDARKGLDMVKDRLIKSESDGRILWMAEGIPAFVPKREIHLLPPFDEFVVGYKSRVDIVDSHNHCKVMSRFGIFKPTVMLDGRIIGSWRNKRSGKTNNITIDLFDEFTEYRYLYDSEIKRVLTFYNNVVQ